MNELKETLWTAIHAVMSEVKNIEKGLTVGDGKMSYKGVSDKDVKLKIGQAMEKHNLIILPVKVNPNIKIDRWEEDSNYGKKTKQTVFTEVLTTYKIIHTLTGESIDVQGYGHGVDSQDKSAGKATTYALKYVLLYTFMVPTGSIDDADKTHSQDIQPPQKKQMTDELFEKAKKTVENGKKTVDEIREAYQLSSTQVITLQNIERNAKQ